MDHSGGFERVRGQLATDTGRPDRGGAPGETAGGRPSGADPPPDRAPGWERAVSEALVESRSILAALAGYPELIRFSLPPDHPSHRLCAALGRAAARLDRLHDDLLALVRSAPADRGPVDLNRVVEAALARDIAGDEAVMRDLAPALPPVQGPAALLGRVVAHLVANAAGDAGGRCGITVATRVVRLSAPVAGYPAVEPGEYVALSVTANPSDKVGADDAPPSTLDALLSPGNGRDRRGPTAALAVIRAVVEGQGGYVDVPSDWGFGATCTVYLPAAAPAGVTPEVDRRPAPGRGSVLVVEDEAEQRRVLLRLLGLLGYRAEAAETGRAALGRLSERPFDLLLLDLELPGGPDGIATLREARARWPGQRAIVLTGHAPDERAEAARRLGAGAYLTKPVTLTELARAVHAEFDHHGGSPVGRHGIRALPA